MRQKILVFLVLALLLAGTASAQHRVTMASPSEGDLVGSGDLVAPLGLKAAQISTDPVALSWPLESAQALKAQATPFVAQSKEYFVDIDAADLAQGVVFTTQAPGALLRINPAPGAAKATAAVDPMGLVLTTADKRAFTAGTGFDQMASADQLKAAGAPFVEGTTAFRLGSEVGAGTLHLQAEGLPAEGRYVLHVFDRGSDVALELQADRVSYLHGQTLTVTARLAGDVTARQVDGFVTSPAGRAWPLTFEATEAGFEARLALDALEAPAPGLWQVHASAQGGDMASPVLRHARTAFDVAVPSARLTGEVAFERGEQGWGLALGVEAAAAGRYEVRGVLYGTGRDGQVRPAAVAHSADHLASGNGTLRLSFDLSELRASGLRAPFQVRDLRLMDQGTLGLLHQQALGLVIE